MSDDRPMSPGDLIRVRRSGNQVMQVGVLIGEKKMFMVGQVAEVLIDGEIIKVRRDMIEPLKSTHGLKNDQ